MAKVSNLTKNFIATDFLKLQILKVITLFLIVKQCQKTVVRVEEIRRKLWTIDSQKHSSQKIDRSKMHLA